MRRPSHHCVLLLHILHSNALLPSDSASACAGACANPNSCRLLSRVAHASVVFTQRGLRVDIPASVTAEKHRSASCLDIGVSTLAGRHHG